MAEIEKIDTRIEGMSEDRWEGKLARIEGFVNLLELASTLRCAQELSPGKGGHLTMHSPQQMDEEDGIFFSRGIDQLSDQHQKV
jgi:hypothetical protein